MMDIKKIMTAILTAAAPIVATAVGGPGAGVLVATAVGSGAAAKKAGKAIENRTGYAVHKVASPVVAIGTPAVLAQYLPPDWMVQICDIMTKLCDNPGVLLGAGAVLWHVLAKNSRDVVRDK